MNQFHARTHFARVALIDARRADIRATLPYDRSHELWRQLNAAPVSVRNRYDRLCRVVSAYRVAGFLNSQEL